MKKEMLYKESDWYTNDGLLDWKWLGYKPRKLIYSELNYVKDIKFYV